MDAVTAPTTVSLSPQPAALPAALQPGAVINALVMKLLDQGQVRLAVANTLLDVVSQVPLVPGTTVRLAVEGPPSDIRLVVIPGQSGGGARSGNAAAATAALAVDADVQVAVRPAATPTAQAPERRAPASLTALSQAVRSAAARQNGLAPLLADIAAAAEADALPAPVRQAAHDLLALRVPLRTDLTASDIKQAFARSGLLFEARLAASPGAPPTGAAPANAAPAQAALAEAAPDLKAALSVFRQVLRTWLDTTSSGAKPAATPGLHAPALPVPDAAVMLPSAGAPRPSPVPAEPVAPATPSQAATPRAPTAPSQAAAPPISAEDAGELVPPRIVPPRDALASGRPSPDRLIDPAARPRAPAPLTGLATLLVAPPAAPRPANPIGKGGEAMAPTVPAPPESHAPPPPYRGAPPAPQPAVAPSLTVSTDPRAIGETLLAETEAALARQTLLQAASVPDRADPQAPRPDSTGPRWNFEIPVATPQGTAIAQFEIARDGHSAPSEDAARVWRVRFTLDVEPMGPVHAHIALAGARASVSLWAEREPSAARLREQAALLRDALTEAEFEPGDVVVREGAPPQARAAAGRFLDRAS
jgi:Flagellar hook-length control protein FliK